MRGGKLCKNELKWMNNGWSKLAIQQKSRKKINFHPFGANKNLEQFETMIKNNIPSFDTTHIFKMLKTLGSKTSP